jgi:hypothetical protein
MKQHRDMPKRYYGYIRIKKPEHPHSVQGWILEHRYVMEQHIGRYLTTQEAVHHINGNRKDNRLENLRLMRFGDHSHLENFGRRRSKEVRLKISKSKIGKKRGPLSENQKRRISEQSKRLWREGRFANRPKISEETRMRLSQAHKGKHLVFSEEHRKKIGLRMNGNKHCVGREISEVTRQKIREAVSKAWTEGKYVNKGKRHD